MDGAELPGKGEPLEADFLSGGTQNEIYEIRRGDSDCVHAHAAARRPARPRQGHPARVADHRGARRHRRAAHRGGRRVRRPVRARPAVLPDGLRRRLVADGTRPRQWPAAVRHRPRRAAALAYQLAEGIALLSKVDWRAKGLHGSRAARRLPRAPGRPVDRLPRADQGPRDSPASTRRPTGCAPTSRSTSSPA